MLLKYQWLCDQLAEVLRKFRVSNVTLSNLDPLQSVPCHFGGCYGLNSKHRLRYFKIFNDIESGNKLVFSMTVNKNHLFLNNAILLDNYWTG